MENILRKIEIMKERIYVCEVEKLSEKQLDKLKAKLADLMEQAAK